MTTALEQLVELAKKTSVIAPKVGVVQGLARSDYDEQLRVHWSTLKILADKAAAHYRHAEDNPGDFDSDAMRLGRAFHVATLEPDLFSSTFAVWPTSKGSSRTNAFREWRADQVLAGREVLDSDEEETVMRMRDSALAHVDAAPYLVGQPELSVFWQHETPAAGDLPAEQLDCKARIDLLSLAGAAVELKSTKNGSVRGFGKEAANYLYHAQAAFYVEGLAKAERLPKREHLIIATENFAPFVTSVFRTPAPALERGRQLAHDALERLAYCERLKRWGGYFEGIVDLELPHWAFPDDQVVDMEVIEHAS